VSIILRAALPNGLEDDGFAGCPSQDSIAVIAGLHIAVVALLSRYVIAGSFIRGLYIIGIVFRHQYSVSAMLKIFFAILISFAGQSGAFTPYQASIIREQQSIHKAPLRSAIVDAVLAQDYAFTDQIKTLTHIDGLRFECCPNTFTNVVTHEIHHQHGRQHTSGVRGDPMSYVLTIQSSGEIVEDNFVLPPLSPNQPWAKPVLNGIKIPGPSPVSVESQIRRLPVQIIPAAMNESSDSPFGR
jgi:hypothetical protein